MLSRPAAQRCARPRLRSGGSGHMQVDEGQNAGAIAVATTGPSIGRPATLAWRPGRELWLSSSLSGSQLSSRSLITSHSQAQPDTTCGEHELGNPPPKGPQRP
jgi:hypothetical protein